MGRRGFESSSGHEIFLSFQRRESKAAGKLFTSYFQYLLGFLDSRNISVSDVAHVWLIINPGGFTLPYNIFQVCRNLSV